VRATGTTFSPEQWDGESLMFSFHTNHTGDVMKKVILAVLALAFALFLALPNLSWAQEDIYKAKCAGCHGADGKGTAAGQKMGAPAFSAPTVQKMSDTEIADFIENGGPQKKATHAFANKGVSAADAAKLAAYVKTLK
jgi:mono/diheme cytochrome c family protein